MALFVRLADPLHVGKLAPMSIPAALLSSVPLTAPSVRAADDAPATSEISTTDSSVELTLYDGGCAVLGVVDQWLDPMGPHLSADFDDGYLDVVVDDSGEVFIDTSLSSEQITQHAEEIYLSLQNSPESQRHGVLVSAAH